jgi:CDP-diacylglycerol--serine O-phosphatidyltransferase
MRYMAPNLVTAGSIVCAVLSMQAALRADWVSACFWILYSTITDKFDGLVARKLNASTALGVQMDSLADLLNYGFMPAALIYAWFVNNPSLGWSSGPALLLLRGICVFYAVAAAFRLARFNVSAGNPDFFFGTPTTFAGGILASLLLCAMKYGDPALSPNIDFPGFRFFGGARLDAWVPYLPYVLLFFSWSMLSPWRVPKGGRIKNRFVNLYISALVVLGWLCSLVRWLPELVVFGGMQFLLWAVYAHFFETPKEKPEPMFPA